MIPNLLKASTVLIPSSKAFCTNFSPLAFSIAPVKASVSISCGIISS